MPKVYWREQDRKAEKLKVYIVGTANLNRLSQTKIANRLLMSQQTYSYKLKTMTFTPTELIALFNILGATPNDIVNLMYMERREI